MMDLRDFVKKSQANSNNDLIISKLKQLIAHTNSLKASAQGQEKTQHGRRLNSFLKALDAIKAFDKLITSGKQAMKDIKGVGKGIATRLDEIIETGTLQELSAPTTDEARIIQDLCTITGLGEARAKLLRDTQQVSSAADLIQRYRSGKIQVGKNALTHHIVVGMEFYDDIKERMPWKEAHDIVQLISARLKAMKRDYNFMFCGSYRRKKKTCGDLDLLVSQRNPPGTEELSLIVKNLTEAGILVGHLTENGKTKYMGVCKLTPESRGRRIDIRYVPYDSMGAGMLYFTGSGKLNKLMRYHANERGYTLNEYGIYHYKDGKKGKEIPANDERDIFKILNIVYLEPHERDL